MKDFEPSIIKLFQSIGNQIGTVKVLIILPIVFLSQHLNIKTMITEVNTNISKKKMSCKGILAD